MYGYSRAIKQLINEFSKMPGIGKRSAERLALYVINLPAPEVKNLAQLFLKAKSKVRKCVICHSISEEERCAICQDSCRRKNVICVVEETKDIIAIERTGVFKGTYHVLGGKIAPLDGIEPDDLTIKELMARVKPLAGKGEVVLATASNAEGEATAGYIASVLKPYRIRLSRIAYGIPAGSSLEYADSLTLAKSLEGRRAF